MPLQLIPGNAEILAILARSITGPYRFVHHALVPYVRIGPATNKEPITVTPSAALRLAPNGPRTLQGLTATLDLAIVFQPSLHLVDVAEMPIARQRMAQKALAALEGDTS